jgi:ATP-dependent DNA helicase RecG
MNETQHIEWKQTWRDEYLKGVCAFANSTGGSLFIGKKDNGEVVHLDNYQKLLEDIPSKIKHALGIVCAVYLRDDAGCHFIEVEIKPYAHAISYRGKYYVRSGSATHELNGVELSEFLLQKSGTTWDALTIEDVSMEGINEVSIQQFISDSTNSGRFPNVDGLTNTEILDKLRLSHNGKIKRAGIILFGKDPNQFLTRPVGFEGMHRVEGEEYPVAALREMLLNALVHKKYMGAAIQIRIFDNKLSIWNEGTLPLGMTVESLKREHHSKSPNPVLAEACFKAGYIDTWGRGTLKIFKACKEAGLPEPKILEKDGGIEVTLFKAISKKDVSERFRNDFGMISERLRSIFGTHSESQWKLHLKLSMNTQNTRQNKLLKNWTLHQELLKTTKLS